MTFVFLSQIILALLQAVIHKTSAPCGLQLMDRNPEFAQVLNNPQQLQEAIQAASNPVSTPASLTIRLCQSEVTTGCAGSLPCQSLPESVVMCLLPEYVALAYVYIFDVSKYAVVHVC